MNRLTRVVDTLLTRLLVILMLALVGAVLWQVAARYLMRSPSSWTEEIARFLLIWISLLGAVYAFRNGAHLGLDLLPQKLGGIAGVRLRRLTLVLVAGFAAVVLVIGGAGLVWLTWDLAQYSAVLGLPMSMVYVVLPFSGLLICLYAAAAWHAPENRSPTPIAPGGE
jgi:TRAP-type C4-dicarboxylate transport system permease small subunit